MHGLGADTNAYAYVRGGVLKNVDPLGLEDDDVKVKSHTIDQDALNALAERSRSLPAPEGSIPPPVIEAERVEFETITIKGKADSLESLAQNTGQGQIELSDLKGAGKGWYNTFVVGTLELKAATDPTLWIVSGGQPAKLTEPLKLKVSAGEESGALVGTGLGYATPVPVAEGLAVLKLGKPAAAAKASRVWTEFLPEAAKRVEAAAAKYGSSGVEMMARKADIKQIDRIVARLGLNKEQRRILHHEITGQDLSLDEIEAIAGEIAEQMPKGGKK